jgi:hypothetical protein
MKITRRHLKRLISEVIITEQITVYDSPFTFMLNRTLEDEALPYRAMVGGETWLTSAFLAPDYAEGPVEAEITSRDEAYKVVESVVQSFPLPGLKGTVEQREGTFDRSGQTVFVVSFSWSLT